MLSLNRRANPPPRIYVFHFSLYYQCAFDFLPILSAITFVALGTSLPDTFASKTAAVQEKYADNAVGNVTGSNSVNVFLGLGLPWLIASIYHLIQVSAY